MLIDLEKLISLRKHKGYKQEDMASKMGMGRTTYIAREKDGSFTESEIGRLATFLDVDIQELYKPSITTDYDALLKQILDNTTRTDSIVKVLLSAVTELLAKERNTDYDKLEKRIKSLVNDESFQSVKKL